MEHFLDSSTLRNDLQARLIEQGLFNTSDNSIVKGMMEAALIPVEQLNEIGEDIQRDMFATTAAGQALNRHGELLGVIRNSGTLPYGSITIYITDSKTASQITTDGAGIYIPAGTRVLGTNFPFQTVEEGYIAPDSSEVVVRVVGTQIMTEPIVSDSLTVLDIDYSTDITNVDDVSRNGSDILCTNNEDIMTGTYQESDSDYRNRMYYSARSYHDRMEDAIRKLLYEIPEVADIKFVKNVYGIGTTAVVVTTKNPVVDDGIITYANARIEEVASDSIRVMTPDYLTVQVYNKLVFANTNGTFDADIIKEQVATSQKSYINNIQTGSKLSITTLQSVGSNASSNLLSCTVTCLKINGKVVTIEDQQSGWDEKFITVDTQNEASIIFS